MPTPARLQLPAAKPNQPCLTKGPLKLSGPFHLREQAIIVGACSRLITHRLLLILHARNAPNIKINADSIRAQVP